MIPTHALWILWNVDFLAGFTEKPTEKLNEKPTEKRSVSVSFFFGFVFKTDRNRPTFWWKTEKPTEPFFIFGSQPWPHHTRTRTVKIPGSRWYACERQSRCINQKQLKPTDNLLSRFGCTPIWIRYASTSCFRLYRRFFLYPHPPPGRTYMCARVCYMYNRKPWNCYDIIGSSHRRGAAEFAELLKWGA